MSDNLILEPTATAQWQKLLKQAEDKAQCQLDEDLESYLIFTLMRFTQQPELASKVMAPEYLRSQGLTGQAKQQQLRDVGDQCLILSGLFPQLAEKRLVRVSYYVDLGRSAYEHLSQILNRAFAELYLHLSASFVQLTDILHNIRSEPALQPLQAHQYWQDSASRNAYRLITEGRDSLPVHSSERYKH